MIQASHDRVGPAGPPSCADKGSWGHFSMARLFRFMVCIAIVVGIARTGGALLVAGETIPVDHREPITVRLVQGRTGLPLAHLRLVFIAANCDIGVVIAIYSYLDTHIRGIGRAWSTMQVVME